MNTIKKESYWVSVLEHFEKKMYKHGVTLPFIIGARTIIEPDKPPQTVSDLLMEMINYPAYTKLYFCSELLDEDIFSILDQGTIERGLNYYQKFGNIICIPHEVDRIPNISTNEQFCDFFTQKYGEIISNKPYSKNSGEWGDFTEDEKNLLFDLKSELQG
jgi:hypothetical protein